MTSNFFSDKLSEQEQQRMDRQMRLPNWNQTALKESVVIIAGIGGLGTEIAKNLAMAGVGTIHLIDMDTVEYSNLNRQILFLDANEGDSKAEAAAKMLKKINPFGTYIPHFSTLQEISPIIYKEADLLIAGLDSVKAREALNRKAVMFKKPLVDGGTANFNGHIFTYMPGKNACLSCDPMRERETEDLAACTLVGIPRKRSHCLLKGILYFESENGRLPNPKNMSELKIIHDYANDLVKNHFPNETEFVYDDIIKSVDHHEPAIITVNAVIASLQSQDSLRILHYLKGTNIGDVNLQYTIYNGQSSKFYQFDKPKNPRCELCGPNRTRMYDISLKASSTFDNLLTILRTKGFEFDSEFPPIIWRIDRRDMEEIDVESTLHEIGFQSYETILLNGFDQVTDSSSDSIYLRIKLVV